MIITIEQFKEIIGSGAGFMIDASSMTVNQIKQLASAAAAAKVTLTLKNVSGVSVDHLKQIAASAPGYVVIDLT